MLRLEQLQRSPSQKATDELTVSWAHPEQNATRRAGQNSSPNKMKDTTRGELSNADRQRSKDITTQTWLNRAIDKPNQMSKRAIKQPRNQANRPTTKPNPTLLSKQMPHSCRCQCNHPTHGSRTSGSSGGCKSSTRTLTHISSCAALARFSAVARQGMQIQPLGSRTSWIECQ